MKTYLVGLLALLSASAAQADWKFTKWDMSLRDVLKAAGPAVYEVKGRKGQQVGKLRLQATVPFTENGTPLIAEFYFDKAKRLQMVRYRPATEMACADQHQLYKRLFGPGLDSTHDLVLRDMPRPVPITSRTTDWHPDNADLMSFTAVSVGDQPPIECAMVIKAPR